MPPAANEPPPSPARGRPVALAWAVLVLVAYVAARAHLLDGWFAR